MLDRVPEMEYLELVHQLPLRLHELDIAKIGREIAVVPAGQLAAVALEHVTWWRRLVGFEVILGSPRAVDRGDAGQYR
jgi:hypothetical protein